MALCRRVPTVLFDQQILVPDGLLDEAAAILEDGIYTRTSEFNTNYTVRFGLDESACAFPKSIRLEHSDIPENDPYKLDLIP